MLQPIRWHATCSTEFARELRAHGWPGQHGCQVRTFDVACLNPPAPQHSSCNYCRRQSQFHWHTITKEVIGGAIDTCLISIVDAASLERGPAFVRPLLFLAP